MTTGYFFYDDQGYPVITLYLLDTVRISKLKELLLHNGSSEAYVLRAKARARLDNWVPDMCHATIKMTGDGWQNYVTLLQHQLDMTFDTLIN